jgi:serine/threonine-protein kinase
MAPEQARGEVEKQDARSDVFGLGAVLCEILTGAPPYVGRDALAVQMQAAKGDTAEAVARLEKCGADVELVRLARACLAPDPANRPADAGTAAAAVAAYQRSVEERLRQAELARAEERERAKALRDRQSRRWTAALTAAGLALLALLAAGAWLWQRQQAEADRRAAAAAAEVDLDAAAAAAAAGEDGRAREALERAEGRLAGGESAQLRERLVLLRDDLAFAAELEDARMRALEATKESTSLKWAASDAAYSKAFADRGLDVTGPGAADAAERIGRSPVKARIVTALDAWADARRLAGAAGWEGLLEAAGRADDSGDLPRPQLREAVLRRDPARLKALAGDPGVTDWPPDDALLLADALGAVGEREAKVGVLRAAQERNPGDFWLNQELGYILGNSPASSRDEAIGFLRAAVAARPRAAGSHNSLAVLLAAQNKPAEAEREYREALRLKPDFPAAHNNLGILLDDQGRPVEAEREYREALRIKSDLSEAHNNLGVLLADQGKAAEAEKEYREAIRIKPDYPGAHNNLGNLLRHHDKPAEAEKEFREAIRIKPDLAGAHYDLGSLLAAHGKAEEAERELREGLRINSADPEALTNLGSLLADRGQPVEAEKKYREALTIKPEFPLAHYNLGVLLAGQRKPAEAEKEFREALRVKPNYAAALCNLGAALIEQGKAAEAEGELRKALKIKEDDAEAHCNLGLALRDQGRFREALDELRRGHELGARNPVWRYPSAAWVADCQRLMEFDALLAAVLGGAAMPADADAAWGLVRVCRLTGRHAAAARFCVVAFAFAAAPANVQDVYNAACSAALAGCGQAVDAPSEDAKRIRLRAQALAWLRADLTAAGAALARNGDPKTVQAVLGALRHWREAPDLAGVRDANDLDKLSEAERGPWRQFWADVDALLQKTAPAK